MKYQKSKMHIYTLFTKQKKDVTKTKIIGELIKSTGKVGLLNGWCRNTYM